MFEHCPLELAFERLQTGFLILHLYLKNQDNIGGEKQSVFLEFLECLCFALPDESLPKLKNQNNRDYPKFILKSHLSFRIQISMLDN